MNIGAIADSIASGVQRAATHSARAAATANGVSAAAQSAQGAFNQNSANNANAIGSERITQQYGYNSAQAASANAFTQNMWDQTAAWNENMFNRQMEFNAAEAEKQRQWSEYMESTRYQRGMADMEKAGLNPILAYGGIATGSGSGGAASVGGASMSPMSGAMASGGLMNGLSASEGNYTGQMEYMSGALGLFGAAIDGISSAFKNLGQLGTTDLGKLTLEITNNLVDDANKKYGTGNVFGVDVSKDARDREKYEKNDPEVKYQYTNKGLFHDNNKLY